MSKPVDKIAEPTCTVSGPGSSQTQDSADARNGNVESKHAAVACACQQKDIDNLIRLATSEGGLVNDDLRRKACK
jgi:phage I-like protein